MRAYRCAGLAACLLLFASALGAAKLPEWTSGASAKYPADKYLVGVGIGTDLDAARSNARAEIAKIFQTRIVQLSQETTKERSAKGGADAGFASEASNELTTRTSTDDVLQGAEIAETYFDKKKKTYYALSVLDKGKTRQNLTREITDLEETAETQIKLSKKAVTVVDEIRALTAALKAVDAKDALLVKKRIVDPVAVPDMPGSLSRAQLQQQRDAAVKKIIFMLEGSGEGNLNGIIGERITGLGFNVTDSSAAAGAATVIALRSAITVAPVDRNNPNWKFYGWNATMEMKDLADQGKVIAAIARQGQSSHISDSAARDKAVAEAAHALAVAVDQQITQYFFGQ